LRAIERVEQRKLSVGQPDRAERVVEAPGDQAGGTLQMQAQARGKLQPA
jgi:hypothetical protein